MADVSAQRRAAVAVLVVAGAALVGAWHLTPPGAPPIYDGVCAADPYRTLGSSPAPAAASKAYGPAAVGAFETSEVVTNDNPPQAQVLITLGTFVSTVPFTLTVTPVQPPGPVPAGGPIDGNVYSIVASTSTGAQLNPVDAQHPVTVLLRATAMSPPRTLERLDGSSWVALKTFLIGCGDTFEATTTKMGDFALVAPQAPTGPPAGGGGLPVAIVAAGATAVVLVVVLGVIRVVRSRTA